MSVGGLLNVYFQVFSSHERLSTVVSTMVGNMMFFIVLFVPRSQIDPDGKSNCSSFSESGTASLKAIDST